MKYLIDSKVVINNDGLTTPGLNETEVPLSPVPLRLLNYLVSNNGKLVTREELYLHIWEAHGLRPSGPGLAKQISHLRKSLSDYGLSDEIILTKPKQGIVFSALVETLESSDEFIETEMPTKRRVKSHRNKIAVFSLALILTSVALVSGVMLLPADQKSELFPVGMVDTCQIYTWDANKSPQVNAYYLMKAKAFIKKDVITCSPTDKVIVQIQQSSLNAQTSIYESKQFFAYCSLMRHDYICNNTYYSAGKK